LQSDVDVNIGEVQASVQIQPLTRCNGEGKVYQRTAIVHLQIEEALTMTSAQLVERARILDRQSPDYFQEECLIYLIREFSRRNDARAVSDLSEGLLDRCKNFIHNGLFSGLRILGLQAVEDACNDVILELFTLVLDLESDHSDFLQVRFGPALQRLIIGVYRRHSSRIQETKDSVPLSSIAGYESEMDGDNRQHAVPLDDIVDHTISIEQRVLYREGLSILEEPYRTVFILRHYEGWQIEAKDPSVPTISRFYQKTPRTIQLWLSHAENILERWRGEHHEPEQ
jgi:DNA-directed RNA polymerase specialized sigma24 family protein